MSVSSNSRKESTESYAAQQMGNTMGVAPELSQLSKTDRPGTQLPSEANKSSDVELEDVEPVEAQANQVKNDSTEWSDVSDDALARDEDSNLPDSTWKKDRVPGADWNRDTEEEIGHS
ncbi:hypothetical protein [Larkinella rosea]|uniref:Uncharacterized protein n=1 Tax=Larkinella rosea TaxID=2025312 RepID=A0A3P1BIP1_9BACT|nr:hypothetical protein [Larkinella rosea]RRB00979.1 hypothetical protein EHT25_22615 [Larkinella rosea]